MEIVSIAYLFICELSCLSPMLYDLTNCQQGADVSQMSDDVSHTFLASLNKTDISLSYIFYTLFLNVCLHLFYFLVKFHCSFLREDMSLNGEQLAAAALQDLPTVKISYFLYWLFRLLKVPLMCLY